MNRDLEETLKELGPEYRTVVARLRTGAGDRADRTGRAREWLVAATLVLIAGLAAVFVRSDGQAIEDAGKCHSAPSEYCASVEEMIATQNPDGSWKNDFLTRRNAAALKVCGDPAARIAYKKAVRNLRAHGVL